MIQAVLFGILFLFYRSLWVFVSALGFLVSKRVRNWLQATWRTLREQPTAPHHLIFAASGELEYAKPLIHRLLANKEKVLVVYTSDSQERLRGDLSAQVAWLRMPPDLPGIWTWVFKRFHVVTVVITRSDLWPGLILAAHKNQLPQLWYAVKTNPRSLRWRPLVHYVLQPLYQKLTSIHVVADSEQKILVNRGIQCPITVTGDPRREQARKRYEENRPLPFAFVRDPQKKLWLCGSTWPEDEKVIFAALSKLSPTERSGLQVMLVPHQIHSPEQLRSLQDQLFNARLTSELATSMATISGDLIVDQVGVLADLYRWADFAFVGGSYREKVHSVLEALVAGCPVAVGPFIENNQEAIEFSQVGTSRLVQVCPGPEELVDFIRAGLTSNVKVTNSALLGSNQASLLAFQWCATQKKY